jgi:hypothetical protein
VWLRNVGALFSGEGELGSVVAPFQPVLGKATYPAPWQAWRIGTEPSAAPQPFELTIHTTVAADVALPCSAYFVPN